MTHLSKLGLSFCLVFVTLEAFQAVFLGSVLQSVDSFLLGAWVFGISVVGCAALTAVFRPHELVVSVRSWRIVLALNLFAAMTWCSYFLAVQLIEPAIVFTIFSGFVPLGTIFAHWCGLAEAATPRRRLVDIGNLVILASVLMLTAITVLGLSGFVRGNWFEGLAGALLSAISGVCTAFVILLSTRLNRRGVGPLAQFGLRFVIYTGLAATAYRLGLDDKGVATQPMELAWVVLIGMAVIAFPLYLVQKAIPLLHPSLIAAMTALGPVMVFLMQLIEGRVDYSSATLTGLSAYMFGALLAVYGSISPQTRLKSQCPNCET